MPQQSSRHPRQKNPVLQQKSAVQCLFRLRHSPQQLAHPLRRCHRAHQHQLVLCPCHGHIKHPQRLSQALPPRFPRDDIKAKGREFSPFIRLHQPHTKAQCSVQQNILPKILLIKRRVQADHKHQRKLQPLAFMYGHQAYGIGLLGLILLPQALPGCLQKPQKPRQTQAAVSVIFQGQPFNLRQIPPPHFAAHNTAQQFRQGGGVINIFQQLIYALLTAFLPPIVQMCQKHHQTAVVAFFQPVIQTLALFAVNQQSQIRQLGQLQPHQRRMKHRRQRNILPWIIQHRQQTAHHLHLGQG